MFAVIPKSLSHFFVRGDQIIERGNHDVLMDLGGEYASMWNIQVQERERMLSMEAVGSRYRFLTTTTDTCAS